MLQDYTSIRIEQLFIWGRGIHQESTSVAKNVLHVDGRPCHAGRVVPTGRCGQSEQVRLWGHGAQG